MTKHTTPNDKSDDEMLLKNPYWLIQKRYNLVDVYRACLLQAFDSPYDNPIQRSNCELAIYFLKQLEKDPSFDFSLTIADEIILYRGAARLSIFLKERVKKKNNLYLYNALSEIQEARTKFLDYHGFELPVFADPARFSDAALTSFI